MTRIEFITERLARGQVAVSSEPVPCPLCGVEIVYVFTQFAPARRFLIYEAGDDGALHSCEGAPRAA